jgi:hypothetical protein
MKICMLFKDFTLINENFIELGLFLLKKKYFL